jgi:NADPH2:quinone reductase
LQNFKAYRTFQENDAVTSRFVDLSVDELDPGDVVVRTKYSTINYKDALSYNGAGKIMQDLDQRRHRHGGHGRVVPGHAVEARRQGHRARLRPGVAHDGGYAEYVRVPGTGSFGAREHDGVRCDDARHGRLHRGPGHHADGAQRTEARQRPRRRDGATGGVGSVAVEILAKIGYHVVAITGKPEEARHLRALGRRKSCSARRSSSRRSGRWTIDMGRSHRQPGGDMLAWLLSTSKISGTVAAIGLAAGMKLNTTVAPFILRGVALLGCDSANSPMSLRQKIWNKLAVEWRPDRVHDQVRTIDFDELPTHFDPYLKGMVRGRTVVRIAPDTHP